MIFNKIGSEVIVSKGQSSVTIFKKQECEDLDISKANSITCPKHLDGTCKYCLTKDSQLILCQILCTSSASSTCFTQMLSRFNAMDRILWIQTFRAMICYDIMILFYTTCCRIFFETQMFTWCTSAKRWKPGQILNGVDKNHRFQHQTHPTMNFFLNLSDNIHVISCCQSHQFHQHIEENKCKRIMAINRHQPPSTSSIFFFLVLATAWLLIPQTLSWWIFNSQADGPFRSVIECAHKKTQAMAVGQMISYTSLSEGVGKFAANNFKWPLRFLVHVSCNLSPNLAFNASSISACASSHVSFGR